MIYLRFSGTDTTLSHLFLPDLRPYTNRHDLRKKSLAAKKTTSSSPAEKADFWPKNTTKTMQAPQEHPSRHPPDTLPIHENRSGRTTGQPDNRTNRQTGKQPDKQANRQTTIHVRQAVRQIQGEKQVPKKEGKKKGETVRRHVSHKRKRGSGEAAYGVFDRFFQLREADHQVPAILL